MPLRCTSRAGGLWLTFCLLLAAIFAVRAGLDSSPDGHPLQALANGAAVAVEARAIGEQPIESIRVGQRVIAHNPLPDSSARTSDAEVGVDAATWRLLRLRAEERWPDGTLDVVEVETLQPPEWVAAHRARPGAWVPLPLDLLEMGLPETLRARVMANEPCPDIPAGPGSVVLTTVNHLNPELYELTLADAAGRESSARPTGLHKFYSEDRGAWTNTRDLRDGERLRSIDGPLTVERLTRVPGVHRVYNLTVAGEHVYHVSSLGLLSHNNVPCGATSGAVPTKLHKNRRDYVGESHVYVIKAPDGTVYKVGKSSAGKRVSDGASKRAESQARKLNRKDVENGGDGGYHTAIRKPKLRSSGEALDYERRWRDTYRRLFGPDKLPGNRERY
jgi:hypothetical protein